MTYHLTVPDMIKSVRHALDNKQLGAQRGEADCLYAYEFGGNCAIGACLDNQTIQEIQEKELDNEPVARLLNTGVLHVGTYEEELILHATQRIHDEWASGVVLVNLNERCPYPDWMREFFNRVDFPDESTMREWLDLVEANYAHG